MKRPQEQNHLHHRIRSTTAERMAPERTRRRSEMIWLNPGKTCSFNIQFNTLVGVINISNTEMRLQSISAQPDIENSIPNNCFTTLHQVSM